jgi:site-specific recombinase XerD
VALDIGTTTALRDYRAQRRARQRDTGQDWPDTGLFFVQPDGRPWHPNTISARLRRLTAKAGLPPIRVHDLRHGAATLTRAAGSDAKVVQATLGHSSLAATERYDHVLPDILAESADAVAAFLDAVRRAA